MKKNILKVLLFPFKALEFILFSVIFVFLIIVIQPFVWCKTKGKKNLLKDDEARVFVSNHYEIYGPIIIFLRFPYRFTPWIIDKMCEPDTIEQHMSIGLYNNYKIVPKWVKWILLKIIKRFTLFIMRIVHPIPVSRDNPRKNIKALQLSVDELEKNHNIFIWPELHSVKSGVGEFMSGFEHLGKYYYQKTGKKISFYPVFTSRKRRTIYIEKPVVFNPDNETTLEKERIVQSLRESMVDSYKIHELQDKQNTAKKQ